MTEPRYPNKRYIGDGVYASFDGYQVWLETERDGRGHSIAIEASVYYDLGRYWDYVREFYAELKKEV